MERIDREIRRLKMVVTLALAAVVVATAAGVLRQGVSRGGGSSVVELLDSVGSPPVAVASPTMFVYRNLVTEPMRERYVEAVADVIMRQADDLTPDEALRLASFIVEECSKHEGLDPFLILAVIEVESSFSKQAVSRKGAVGLMQVKPSTARFIARKLGVDYRGVSSLYDPETNLKLGIHYLGELNGRFKSIERTLAAYNFGPNRPIVHRLDIERNPPRYVEKVLRIKRELERMARTG